uniref:hypothetical protein n=1 Tax=Burkholderia pseudomallei TaxID=28450 RepID=UPI001C722AE2
VAGGAPVGRAADDKAADDRAADDGTADDGAAGAAARRPRARSSSTSSPAETISYCMLLTSNILRARKANRAGIPLRSPR